MLNYNQRVMNKRQQLLNNNQQIKSRVQGSSGKKEPKERVHHEPGNLLIPHRELFRRSSLVLIAVLGRNFSNKLHVRELARSVHYDVSIISKNLKKLEELGLVTHDDVGNLVLYQANMGSVLLRQMKIFLTLLELTGLIRDLNQVTTNFILYGSCAKGEDTYESDIDLFIETMDKEAVHTILARHRREMTRELSPIIHTPDETYRLKAEDSTLYNNIQQGIILKG